MDCNWVDSAIAHLQILLEDIIDFIDFNICVSPISNSPLNMVGWFYKVLFCEHLFCHCFDNFSFWFFTGSFLLHFVINLFIGLNFFNDGTYFCNRYSERSCYVFVFFHFHQSRISNADDLFYWELWSSFDPSLLQPWGFLNKLSSIKIKTFLSFFSVPSF